MKLEQATHKAFLYQIVNVEDGQLKKYPLDKLGTAIAVSKILASGSEEKDGSMIFKNGEVVFKAEEWVFLKDALAAIKDATLPEGKLIEELKEILT